MVFYLPGGDVRCNLGAGFVVEDGGSEGFWLFLFYELNGFGEG